MADSEADKDKSQDKTRLEVMEVDGSGLEVADSLVTPEEYATPTNEEAGGGGDFTEKPTTPEASGKEEVKKSTSEEDLSGPGAKKEGSDDKDHEFVVEEETGADGDDSEDDETIPVVKSESPKSSVKTVTANKKETENIAGKSEESEEKVNTDDDVILVNPLFGKPSAKNNIPVYNVDDSDSCESGSEQDFSADVNVSNFNENNVGVHSWKGVEELNQSGGQPGETCGCECYHEKRILVNEIERLRKAVFELSERHSVLEDYVEVEFGDGFEKFMRNREHLVKMGFGSNESTEDVIDGKRSSKSSELVELLKMIKEQAEADGDKSGESGTSNTKASSVRSESSVSQYKSLANSGERQRPNSSKQPKPKPIPSISSDRSEFGRGGGGAMGYQQRQAQGKEYLSRNPGPGGYQYQQQHVMAAPQSALTSSQSRHYYDSMYANAISGGYGNVSNSRDYITAVGRNDVMAASMPFGFGHNSSSGYRNMPVQRNTVGYEESRESKKERKRKRKSENSESGSNTSTGTGTSSITRAAATSGAKHYDTTDSRPQTIDDINPSTKRICVICSKIFGRKSFRDHLMIHQGVRMECPLCKEEYLHRKKLRLHMRDEHNISMSDSAVQLDEMFKKIDLEFGPIVNKMLGESQTPTKQQIIAYNAEVLKQNPSKPSGNGDNFIKPNPAARSGGAPKNASTGNPAAPGTRVSNNQQQRQKQKQFNSNPNNSSAPDLYGPGGYAQYAARYLQQRSAAQPQRLYTPF